jgi:hypothetical protein
MIQSENFTALSKVPYNNEAARKNMQRNGNGCVIGVCGRAFYDWYESIRCRFLCNLANREWPFVHQVQKMSLAIWIRRPYLPTSPRENGPYHFANSQGGRKDGCTYFA